jgi:hypothetical protein
MDNEPVTPLKVSRIIGIVLLFGTVFIISMWFGHALGNTTRRATLAAFSAPHEQAIYTKSELKHAKHSVEQPKIGTHNENSAGQPALSRQRSILLIGIDSFQADVPRLEAVWMVLYLRDLPHFMLMPVYPYRLQGEAKSAVVDQNLASIFVLDDGQSPSSSFLQALKDKQLRWDGYIVLDRSALSEIIELTSAGEDATHLNQQISASNLPDIEDSPMRALLGQANLAQEFCRYSGVALTSDSSRIASLIGKASAHIRTDLDLSELAGEVKNALRYSGGISCEFPSFEIAANLP